MTSLANQSFSMFPSQNDDGFSRYPEPPHSATTTSPMDMSGMFSMPTSMAFEPGLYAETSHYTLGNGQTSPGMYPEDGDIRMPSSSLSTASATSSAIGSPQSNPGQSGPAQDWNPQGMSVHPSIVGNDFSPEYGYSYNMEDQLTFDYAHANKGFVDPSLIHEISGAPMPAPHFDPHFRPHGQQHYDNSPSISPSPMHRNSSASPPFIHHNASFQATPFNNSPYPTPIDPNARRPSMSSFISPTSAEYPSGDENREKQRCTYPDCGKVFKDLKAHMLTHQNERPEKCPIQTCEYHTKGFARKYDKNRHTLTHYKGTMVCGFCPGSGSPAEKSFNRADVFKRHLTAVHSVEQTPPNSRKKTPGMGGSKKLTGYAPDATGKCSTCSQTFANAQDFYEHLDDCVLRIVQQEDPAEAVNAARLAEVENDKDVLKTLAKHKVKDEPPTDPAAEPPAQKDGDSASDSDDVDMEEEIENAGEDAVVFGDKRPSPHGVQKSRGLTHSRGGVPLKSKGKDRQPKKHPKWWGCNARNMNMKKRVMACFDGPRRLAKDDMLLCTDHELRLQLSDGKHYVTDLDILTLRRANGFLGATDEEKGPWISDDPTEEQKKQMHEIQQMLGVAS